jgi:hypothetical protein
MSRRGIWSSNLGRWFRFGRHGHVFFFGLLGRDGSREAPWLAAWASSSTSYGAWNEAMFLPTRSRLWEELVLRTYHGENRPHEAGDGEAARAVFNSGWDGVRRCSGSKDSSGGNDVGGGSSSKHHIGMRGFGVAARRRWRGSVMAAGGWAKFTQDWALFIGVFG